MEIFPFCHIAVSLNIAKWVLYEHIFTLKRCLFVPLLKIKEIALFRSIKSEEIIEQVSREFVEAIGQVFCFLWTQFFGYDKNNRSILSLKTSVDVQQIIYPEKN